MAWQGLLRAILGIGACAVIYLTIKGLVVQTFAKPIDFIQASEQAVMVVVLTAVGMKEVMNLYERVILESKSLQGNRDLKQAVWLTLGALAVSMLIYIPAFIIFSYFPE